MDFIATKMTSTIQNSDSIDTGNSTFENDTGKLSLNVPNLSKSPTNFYMENDIIYMREGSNPIIKISSDSIKCTQLKFTRISSPKIPDQVIIDTKCEPINSDIKNLEQEISIHTSVSLRKWKK